MYRPRIVVNVLSSDVRRGLSHLTSTTTTRRISSAVVVVVNDDDECDDLPRRRIHRRGLACQLHDCHPRALASCSTVAFVADPYFPRNDDRMMMHRHFRRGRVARDGGRGGVVGGGRFRFLSSSSSSSSSSSNSYSSSSSSLLSTIPYARPHNVELWEELATKELSGSKHTIDSLRADRVTPVRIL